MQRHLAFRSLSFLSSAAFAALTALTIVGCVDAAQEPSTSRDDSAQPGDATGAASDLSSAGKGRHCNVPVTATRDGAPVGKGDGAKDAAAVECFDTFSEAIYSATKGTVKLPADATPADLATLSAEERALAGTYLISVEYIAPRWDGFWGSRNFTSSVTCDQGYSLSYSDLTSIGWQDRISSAYTSPGCAHAYHYDNAGFGGGVIDCHPAINGHDPCYYNLGAIDDRTSSIRWTNSSSPF